MPLTQEQIEEIKKQLLDQVEARDIPNKKQIIEHIEKLDSKGLENFLKQNKIQISDQEIQQDELSKTIFQSIVKNEIPSYKIAENKDAIAILEINPLSEGHALVIPKEKTSIEKIPKSAFNLAQKIAKKIKTKLKPIDIKIETFSFQNYPAINIIPIYENKELKKEKAKETDLLKLQSKLETKKIERKIITKTKQLIKLPEISFRIP